jgi:type IV secretion system protein VirD4
MAPQQQSSTPEPRRFSPSDLFGSLFAGGLATLIGGGALFAAGVLLMVAGLIIGLLLTYAGKGFWLFILAFAAVSVAAGLWFHFNGAAADDVPRFRRLSGIHGNACYATLDDTRARGLIPDRFDDAVYLGAFVNWYRPLNELLQPTGYQLGYTGENNILTVAPAGTGKFTTSIAQTCLLSRESMFILDVKGENYAVTGRHRACHLLQRVVLINPFNMFADALPMAETLTDGFNPLADLDPASDTFTTSIDALAAAIIVQEGNDPHWPNRARDLVACLMAHVCSDPHERQGNNTLPRVRAILGLPREEFAAYMQVAFASNKLPRVHNIAGGFTDPASREVGSIISTAIGQLAFLDQPQLAAFLSHSTFSFRQLRTEPLTIYCMLPPNELITYYRFARLIVQSCMNALSVEPKAGDRRVLLLLDEQAQLRHMESIENAIALLRGYRVRIWSVFQDLNQLESLYGARWESFVSNAGVVQVFTTNDKKTADYFSAKVGTYTGVALSSNSGGSYSPGAAGAGHSSTSYGTSTSPAPVPFLPPQSFYSLPENLAVLFLRGFADPIPALKTGYWEQAWADGMHDLNPYRDPTGFREGFLDRLIDERDVQGLPLPGEARRYRVPLHRLRDPARLRFYRGKQTRTELRAAARSQNEPETAPVPPPELDEPTARITCIHCRATVLTVPMDQGQQEIVCTGCGGIFNFDPAVLRQARAQVLQRTGAAS